MLRVILRIYSDAKNINQSETYENMSKKTLLCIHTDTVVTALCLSLSTLLCYKISKEVYQRLSRRVLRHDVLQTCYRTTSLFKHLRIVTSKETNFKFMNILLDKYLTNDVLIKCYSKNILICLTLSVIHQSVKDTYFRRHTDCVLVKLSHVETNNKRCKLLHNAFGSTLHLRLSTKEERYASQKFNVIEKSLFTSFVYMVLTLKKRMHRANRSNAEEMLTNVVELGARSAYIFHVMFTFLKELLVQLHDASAVLAFTASMLKRIFRSCETYNKDIVDLYLKKLRSYVRLLRRSSKYHTAQTQKYVLQTMKQ
ncbi:Uncharacterized protein DBV15_12805, partial [Temnothorax longispinosus]